MDNQLAITFACMNIVYCVISSAGFARLRFNIKNLDQMVESSVLLTGCQLICKIHNVQMQMLWTVAYFCVTWSVDVSITCNHYN